MANLKISELTAAGALTGAELVEAVQGGVNVRTTTQDIANLGGGGSGVQSVTGDGVDNTDPDNPVLTFPTPGDIGAIQSSDVVGVQDLFIPASAMWPRYSDGCAAIQQIEMATSLFNIQSLDFDQTTQEFCQFQIRLPRKWNNGTITAKFYWTATSGAGTVQWGISAGAYSNDDALTVALGSAQTADDTLIAANDLHISPETSAITVAGTPADEDFLAVQISRNPASDTLTADARLLGVVLYITTNAAKDA